MKKTTIRVGQRLIRWDGIRGYVDLNSKGVSLHKGDDEFQVIWDDGESEYLTLAQFETEGIRRGKGVMAWAR